MVARRAYATTGDITDELQVKDIVVDTPSGEMEGGLDLGTID